MVLIAEDLGLTDRRYVENFPTLEAGYVACVAVHAAIASAAARA